MDCIVWEYNDPVSKWGKQRNLILRKEVTSGICGASPFYFERSLKK